MFNQYPRPFPGPALPGGVPVHQLPLQNIWHARVISENGKKIDHYFFSSATEVILSAQGSWSKMRGISKRVDKDRIEFYDNNQQPMLIATKLAAEIKTDPIQF